MSPRRHASGGAEPVRTEFVINDQAGGYPSRTVETTAAREEIAGLVGSGFLVRRGLLPAAAASELAEAVLALGRAELADPHAEYLTGDNLYLRSLIDKDPLFHRALRPEPVLSIARTVLGPQVWADLDARLNFPGRAGVAVPWHVHMPVIPDPLPPFFCYPHQIHCLIYLDPVTPEEGALCVLPGSHRTTDLHIPLGDGGDRPGQVELYFEPGDAVVIHGNLWHRTVPSRPSAGYRRLLLLGYVPSWVKGDTGRGVKADDRLRSRLARQGDAELRELLGGFTW